MSASISIRVAFVSAVVAGMALAEAAVAGPTLKLNPIPAWKLGEQPKLKLKPIPAWKLGEQPKLKLNPIPAWKLGEKPPKGPAHPPHPPLHPPFHPPHHPPKGFGHPSWWYGPGRPPYAVPRRPRYEPAPYVEPALPPLELLNENPVKVVCWLQGEQVVIPPGENIALPSDRENLVVFHNGERWEEHTLVSGVYRFVHPGPVWELVHVP